MQDATIHQDAAIRAGHHAAVYCRLKAAAAAADRPLPRGTEGAIGRAQSDYHGDPEAAALLREINVAVFRLRQAILTGAEAETRAQRESLDRLAGAWLYHAPLHHVAELLPAEGAA
jgi:hypothetical protein